MMLGADVHQVTQQGWTGAHICAIRGCTTCLNVRYFISCLTRIRILMCLGTVQHRY